MRKIIIQNGVGIKAGTSGTSYTITREQFLALDCGEPVMRFVRDEHLGPIGATIVSEYRTKDGRHVTHEAAMGGETFTVDHAL